MADDPKRWIWQYGQAQGPYTVDQLWRMAMLKEINSKTLFWSEKGQIWKTLSGLIFDIEPDRLDQMIKAGITRVQVLVSREKDCKVCSALPDKIFSIQSPPVLPPEGCRCRPWCKLILIAVED